LEGDVETKTDHCTLLRTVGRFEFDVSVDFATNHGYNTLTYSAALIVESREAIATAILSGTEATYDPTNPSLGVHCRVVQTFFNRTFTNAIFRTLEAAGPPAEYTFFPVLTGDEQRGALDWDVTQKVKLTTDEELYLVLRGTMLIPEENLWFTVGQSRTLFAD